MGIKHEYNKSMGLLTQCTRGDCYNAVVYRYIHYHSKDYLHFHTRHGPTVYWRRVHLRWLAHISLTQFVADNEHFINNWRAVDSTYFEFIVEEPDCLSTIGNCIMYHHGIIYNEPFCEWLVFRNVGFFICFERRVCLGLRYKLDLSIIDH